MVTFLQRVIDTYIKSNFKVPKKEEAPQSVKEALQSAASGADSAERAGGAETRPISADGKTSRSPSDILTLQWYWDKGLRTAARVGKGLSAESKRALLLQCEHWLEASDPHHRYGSLLRPYYQFWLKSLPPVDEDATASFRRDNQDQVSFFFWLDEGEGRFVDLADEGVPRFKLESYRVRYLRAAERLECEVIVDRASGLLRFKLNGELVHTLDTPPANLDLAASIPMQPTEPVPIPAAPSPFSLLPKPHSPNSVMPLPLPPPRAGSMAASPFANQAASTVPGLPRTTAVTISRTPTLLGPQTPGSKAASPAENGVDAVADFQENEDFVLEAPDLPVGVSRRSTLTSLGGVSGAMSTLFGRSAGSGHTSGRYGGVSEASGHTSGRYGGTSEASGHTSGRYGGVLEASGHTSGRYGGASEASGHTSGRYGSSEAAGTTSGRLPPPELLPSLASLHLQDTSAHLHHPRTALPPLSFSAPSSSTPGQPLGESVVGPSRSVSLQPSWAPGQAGAASGHYSVQGAMSGHQPAPDLPGTTSGRYNVPGAASGRYPNAEQAAAMSAPSSHPSRNTFSQRVVPSAHPSRNVAFAPGDQPASYKDALTALTPLQLPDDAVVQLAELESPVTPSPILTGPPSQWPTVADASAAAPPPPGAPAGTDGKKEKCSWIYVMDTRGELFMHAKERGKFHHSSFLGGGAVLAAGGIDCNHGLVVKLSAHSGHYRPSTDTFEYFIQQLKDMGADLSQCRILEISKNEKKGD